MPLDRERLRQLLELFKASAAQEFALQEGECYFRFVRRSEQPAAVSGSLQRDTPAQALPTAAPGAASAPAAKPEPIIVKSRVVGLFYRGRQPGEPPLVEVGSVVEEGQPLGIVEVLRKPTVVTSPVAGEVLEIVHEDGHGVQYGDPLFVIQPHPQMENRVGA